jgi:regulator of replication initiation timing
MNYTEENLLVLTPSIDGYAMYNNVIQFSTVGIYGNYDNLDDFIGDVKEFLLEENKALRMNLGNLQKRLEALLSEMIDEVESVFEMYSTPLEEIAKFSNGETIYKTVA